MKTRRDIVSNRPQAERGRARLSSARHASATETNDALKTWIRRFVAFAQIFEGGKGARASARFTARSQGCADVTVPFVREAKRAEARAPLLAPGAVRTPIYSVGTPCLQAFSLIEIMVAVTLLAVIIVGLLAMFYQTQRAFRAGMAQVDVLEGGRATMELITRELQEVSASSDSPVTNFEARVPVGYASLNLELPAGETISSTIQDLWFLRRFNDDWFGESYHVGNPVAGVGTLYRMFVTGGRTNAPGLTDLLRTPLIDTNSPLTTNFIRVADGVVHFRVVPFDSRGLLLTNNDFNAGIYAIPSGPIYYSFSNTLPAYVDIELAVLEPKAVEQVRARANNIAKAIEYLKKQPGRMHFFKQRVALRNAPQYLSVTNVP